MDKRNTSLYVKLVLYFIAVVFINIAGISLFFRIDLTGNKVYSLSKVSKQVVSTLSEPLTVNVFFTRNLPAPYNSVERYLKDLLDEYALSGGKNFNYRFFDVTPEDEGGTQKSKENQQMAQDYGLYPVQIQAIEKDEVKFKKAFMGLVIIHGDMIEKIPAITSSNGLEYIITTSIMKLNNKISALIKLKDLVNVRLYMSPSLRNIAPYMGIEDLSQITEQIRNIVDGLNKKMYDKVTFSLVEPTDKPEIEKLLKSYSLLHLAWPDLGGTNVKAGEGVIGLVLEQGGKTAVLPMMQVYSLPPLGTRYSLYKANEIMEMMYQSIETIIGINENIGYLSDHGTPETFSMPGMPRSSMKEPISNFSELVSKSYTLKDIRLGETGIPKGLKSLIIGGPTEKFTDYELYQIDQALMQGTNIALFLDKFQEVQLGQQGNPFMQQPSRFVPIDTGLEKLLDHYGVRIRNSIVLDENCYKQRLSPQFGGGQQEIFFAPIIQGESINNTLDYMKNIKSLITLAASPIEVDEKKIAENKIKAYKLFSSSDKSWEMRGNINLDPMFIRPPASGEKKESMPLAYLLEGNFRSYFAGKPIPEKPSPPEAGPESKNVKVPQGKSAARTDLSKVEGNSTFVPASLKPGRIFLMATSQMLSDKLLDSEGQSPNATFVMNILDVISDRLDMAMMRSKTLSINPLEETQVKTKMFIKTFNIAGVPALVVCFGLLVWVKRRMRKKSIELMYDRRR